MGRLSESYAADFVKKMSSEDFLRFCCLNVEISQYAKLTPTIVMDILRNRCFDPLDNIPFANETMKAVELKRRKTQLLLWFWRNTSYFKSDNCPALLPSQNPACSKPTENIYAIYTVIWIVLLVMIFFTNLLIIVSVLKVPQLRENVANLFIISLSVSDLLVGFSVIPIKIGFYMSNMTFCYSLVICRAYLMADSAFFIVSIVNLVVIAVDRHIALNYPYKYPNLMTRRRAKTIIACTWIYGLCYSSLWNVKFDDVSQEAVVIKEGACQMNRNYILVFMTYVLHYIIPIVAMGIIYFRILSITKNHARNISESVIIDNNNVELSTFDDNNNVGCDNKAYTTNTLKKKESYGSDKQEHYIVDSKRLPHDKTIQIYQQSARSYRRSSSKSIEQYRKIVRRATQMVAAVYGTFIICWLPVAVFAIVYMICGDCAKKINNTAYVVLIHIFPLMNSMMNAFLYAMMNRQFRKGFKRVLGLHKLKSFFMKLSANERKM